MASQTQLKRSNPEAEGIDATAVLNFIHALEQHPGHPLDAMQGFMLLRHGHVAAEGWWQPYAPPLPHQLYSLSKSFTSSAIGLAVAEGLLTVDDSILSFFPDDAPANPSQNLKAMRVRHLLSMNTGHHEDTTERVFQNGRSLNLLSMTMHGQPNGGGDDNWPRVFLSLPVEHEPGTWFVYNTAATYMLSAIITKLTGESLLDYLRPRLFTPLGIENPNWDSDPRGINIGGSGLHITLENIAHFGQMYLQKGMWQGQRILSEAWIAEATQATSDNSNTQTNPDWVVGYGYQFWRCRHNGYRGDGAFGQYCLLLPEQDVVLAMIGGVRDMQVILDKVWEHLLPALQAEPLPANSSAYDALCDKLTSLSLPLSVGQPSSPLAAQVSGKTFHLEDSELQLASVALECGEEQSKLIVRDGRGEYAIQIGYGAWQSGHSDYSDEPVAACGAWTAVNTYEIRLCYTTRVYCPILRFHFADDKLQLEVDPNVFWGLAYTRTINGCLYL
ncbi:MAG: serine hydrolase [Ardenticatenaceae bacterium]|nr:serine hydrolase [Ardenticatenaceae bacterium]